MADVTSTLTSWSSTAASNLPANSAAVGPNTLADNQRVIQAVVRAALAGDGTIASATTTDLSTVNDGDITVSGTTTITGFGTLTAGIKKILTFSGALTLTHNATSLILPGAANITTAAGDVAIMRSLGAGNWRCIFYQRAANVYAASGANADITSMSAVAPWTNGLINGGFELWNNGTSVAVPASTTAQVTANSWYLSTSTNQACTVSQQTGLTDGSQFCGRIQRNSGQTGVGSMVFEQSFELAEIVKYRNKKITVSFQASTGDNWSPASGTLNVNIFCGTGAARARGYSPYTGETNPLSAVNNIAAGSAAAAYSYTSAAVIPTNTTQMTMYWYWTPVGTAGANDWLQLDDVMWSVGTGAQPFERKDAVAAVTKQIQSINATVAANALTLTLNPTTLDFRSATLGSGTVNTRVVASPISVVVSSGSTLGTINAIAARLAIIALDNAGTVELAVVNLAGGNNLDETTLISTTAEGGAGAADSANVIYSTTARTNVAFRVVGFVDITEATAGTWATAPSTIQGIGGQALAALSSLGYGQTWQSVTRTSGTTYYNTTGRPIVAKRDTTNTGGLSGSTTVTINGVSAGNLQIETGGGYSNTGSIIIPAGASYVFTDTNITSFAAYELR